MACFYQFCAVLISVAGVVVITYSEGFGSFGALGITLAVGSACCAALYRVNKKFTNWLDTPDQCIFSRSRRRFQYHYLILLLLLGIN